MAITLYNVAPECEPAILVVQVPMDTDTKHLSKSSYVLFSLSGKAYNEFECFSIYLGILMKGLDIRTT